MAKYSNKNGDLNFSILSLVVLCTMICFYGCKSDSGYKDCEDFKTGEFKYLDPKFSQWKVKRTESTQTEVNDSLHISIESKVVWLSDCEFQLIHEGQKASEYLKLTDTLTVEFVEVKNDSYVYRAYGGGSETKGTMVLVE